MRLVKITIAQNKHA